MKRAFAFMVCLSLLFMAAIPANATEASVVDSVHEDEGIDAFQGAILLRAKRRCCAAVALCILACGLACHAFTSGMIFSLILLTNSGEISTS